MYSHDGALMNRALLIATLLTAALANPGGAQTVSQAALPAAAPVAPALHPFLATYQVFHEGRELGQATLQVVHVDTTRWRVDLDMRGQGLLRLTGLNVQQSTIFDSDGHAYRPLAQSTVKRAFLSNRKSVGVYDWNTHTAHWTGDVKKVRTSPVPLHDGDMSGLLIDLALVRDAQPGSTLHYRFVEDGRVRDHNWMVAPQTQATTVGDLSYDAMRASRVQAGGQDSSADSGTVVWVAAGVPTPIRILQRDNGADSTDLRLVQYK